MIGQQSDFWNRLNCIASAQTLADLRKALMDSLRANGLTAAYFLAPVTADPRVGRRIASVGFPDGWEDNYRSTAYLTDPLPSIAMNRPNAFRWSEAAGLVDLPHAATDHLNALSALGFGEGIAVPCFGPMARSAFIGVSGLAEGVDLCGDTLRQVQMAGQTAFQQYCEIVPSTQAPAPKLSRRELEVMRWIGEGKSNAVIAAILDISKSSVDIYVKRIFAKLGVNDRTSASVRALTSGLITHGEFSAKRAAPRIDSTIDQNFQAADD